MVEISRRRKARNASDALCGELTSKKIRASIVIMYTMLCAAFVYSLTNYFLPGASTHYTAESLVEELLPQRDNIAAQSGIVALSPPRRVMKVPEGHEKTFFYDGKKISFSIARALHSRGWQRVNDYREAQLIYYYSTSAWLFKKLKPWQRFNHLPNNDYWNNKEKFVEVFKAHQERTGSDPYFLPESYRLASRKERKAFKERLTQQGGMEHPWVLKKPDVNQGKGIEMIAPNSERLRQIVEQKDSSAEKCIIQKYICNEMTWDDRKFDVRMFWLVASVDPLVVLYQDGYTRIGNGVYTEDNFDNTVSHLTTHTGLGEEGKTTFEEFGNRIIEHQRASPNLAHIRDPVNHVKSQFKDSLAQFIAAFKDVSFSPTNEELTAQNGYGFYGADFILDKDLDVWLLEPQKGCGMDEDYDFRVQMHDRLFRGMVDTLDEIWHKQEGALPLFPLESIGAWEVIYADGWRYTYEGYERVKNKPGCGIKGERRNQEVSSIST